MGTEVETTKVEAKDPYPQHTLLKAQKERHAIAREFLDHIIEDRGFSIMVNDHNDYSHPAVYSDSTKSELLASFLGIDYKEFQNEKDRMLDSIRAARGER